MDLRTPLTEILSIIYPIIQAPMAGGATTPEFVAAACNAGILGSFAAGYLQPDQIRTAIKAIRKLTNKAFAVSLFIPEKHSATEQQLELAVKAIYACCEELHLPPERINPPYAPAFDAQMQVLLEEEVKFFSFSFGIPTKEWLEKCKQQKIITLGTATNLAEAQRLQISGVDIITAQGSEAGGHRSTFIGSVEDGLINTRNLTRLLVEKIKTPIVAAGGIHDKNAIQELVALGAAGVQIGSAFLCCTESGINPAYKQAILRSGNDTTELTRVFSGKMARGINNKFMQRMLDFQDKILNYPIQNALTQPMRKAAQQQGNIDFMSLFAGQSAHLCEAISVADVIKKLSAKLTT